MDTAETVLAKWEIDRSQTVFFASLVTAIIGVLFIFSFMIFFLLQQTTNIVLLVVPIVLFLMFIAALPELFKSLGVIKENSEVSLTDQGIYKKVLGASGEPKFVPWSQMSSFDTIHHGSFTMIGKLYKRPDEFFIKSKYEEDNFSVAAFGENADVLRAYFKENNVPFGFAKNS